MSFNEQPFNPTSREDRVLIVDFNHMAHIFSYGGSRMSYTKKVGEQIVNIDTTIATGAIKNIFNWSKGGKYPTVVCFDQPCPARKGYFKLLQETSSRAEDYKGKRESMRSEMFEGIDTAKKLLAAGGVPVLQMHNWEADDLIFLVVEKAKQQYPNHYIDIVTNDADLLPLVDERVSVFLRSRQFTYAETKDLEKSKYIQVTPANYQKTIEALSAFKGLYVPYNSLLLYKLTKGDSADNIQSPYPPRTMPPRRLMRILWEMQFGKLEKGFDLVWEENLAVGIKEKATKEEFYFGYADPNGISDRCYVLDESGERITCDVAGLFAYTPTVREYYNKEGVAISKEEAIKIGRPGGAYDVFRLHPKVDYMVAKLVEFGFTEEEGEIFRRQYVGMNLAQPFPNLGEGLSRGTLKLSDIVPYNGRELDRQVSALGIHLNSRYL